VAAEEDVMSDSQSIVVVGGGLAAAKAVETLRENGFAGTLTLVGAEQHRPYERPPLSKGYLLGTDELDSAFVHPHGWYAEHRVDLRLGEPATSIDLAARTVTTGSESMGYDRLLIATGSTPRRLAMADDSGAPVAYLRTMDDSRRLKEALTEGARIAIIGGGWIGLEVASAARNAGCEVTVLEALELPLARVLGREVAEVFASLHTENGVDLRTGVTIVGIDRQDGRTAVRLDGGDTVEADLLVVGVGISPNTELAERAGLATENGIVCDEHLRTSDPNVFAAGDVASAHHPRLGRHVRVEHWDNAIEQGIVAARNLLGRGESYDRLPYFFTDQYDLGMEYVGHVGPEGYDEVVLRGDVAGRVFTAFWLKDGAVVAGMHANDWDAIDPVRRIVETGAVDLAALRDARVTLVDVA
jgi:3-phenylpropionate/trans-cinnamate dioxygenase ferredoxin reductase component